MEVDDKNVKVTTIILMDGHVKTNSTQLSTAPPTQFITHAHARKHDTIRTTQFDKNI